MRELIYRDDCNLHAPSLDRDVMIWNEISNLYQTTRERRVSRDDLYEFARTILKNAQNVIDAAPTITTDEVLAYKCPECRVVSILYDPNEEFFCPNCGMGRKQY